MSMRTARDERLRKHERITRRTDYARVFAQRRSSADDVLIVYVANNGLAWSRLGLSVSKRIGNAVRRNYVRRRIREAFRTLKADLPKGFDIIVVARPKAGDRMCDAAGSLAALVVKAIHRRRSYDQEGKPLPDPDTAAR